MRTLLIDNYDSYTYNLYQLIAVALGSPPDVLPNDAPEWAGLDLGEYDAIVISPGPGRPDNDRDTGVCLDVLRRTDLPVLGVCMGHQVLAVLAGATVAPAPAPRHGYLERVAHRGDGLFEGIPQDFSAVRYHSLCAWEPLPEDLEVTAWARDGVVMGLRHKRRPWWGVQFHPESIATEQGERLIRNFGRLAGQVAPTRGGAAAARRWRLRVDVIDREIDTERAFTTLFGRSRYAYWLDSSRLCDGLSRFSFIGDGSGPLGEVLTSAVAEDCVRLRTATGRPEVLRGSIFDVLDERIRARAVTSPPELPFEFGCGYVGYFGYEMKAACGSANRHTSAEPDAAWMAATRLIAVDHREKRTWLVALCDGGPDADAWLETTRERLLALTGRPAPAAGAEPCDIDPASWLDRPRGTYLADIEECRRQLRAGESYEICLTNTVELPFHGSPLELYRRLRRANPAPYAAYLRIGDLHVLCSSPERFLKVGVDGMAESRPIKGTAPRDPDAVRDRAQREALSASPKTRAENLMIVDLVRNDLGRVCEIGSVRVPRFMEVEAYATVHQLVSTVRGRLRRDVSAVQAARTCFPGGSMTGAPKLRTMEIIDRLEERARGVYSGTLGFFGLDGTADLNIVIRTAVVRGDTLTIGAGGAIVLDSDPADEHEEMLIKARAVTRALTTENLAGHRQPDLAEEVSV